MLGIDIGGTKLLFASVKDGKIVKKVKYKIKHRGREEIVDKIVRMIKKFKQRYVGIG
ncbi:MAG TPA: ROK family protein, partial [Candidatus Aenigmarchaeota archaeon]|nr:ROK family protein [Candidatus Aenigmarchaeota archaeon]